MGKAASPKLLQGYLSLQGRFRPGDKDYVRLRHGGAQLAGEDAGDEFRAAVRVQQRSIVDGSHIALLDSSPERARFNTADILLAMNDLLRMDIKGYERERMKLRLTSDVLQQRSQYLEF